MNEMNINYFTPDWSHKVILIVEDTETSNLFFHHALRQTQAELIYAESGTQAIELVLQDKDEIIDLILMDINLPHKSGLDATREIKQKRPDLPIVIQTAYTNDYNDTDAYGAGCDDFILKPIRLTVLYNTIAKFLGK
ncbi:MAG: response regulator [Bacteroidales bacterium]|nr:response regulator [Bacteroidales bacterium]MCF8457877.1 response regulator [Bacteroidales bacterium]